jgi:hypothetical protein
LREVFEHCAQNDQEDRGRLKIVVKILSKW